MNRPSQRVDLQLIESGMALLPETGCTGLSVRKLVEHANVNLGMFHYHFKNKDNFIRVVLQRVYEEMFAALTVEVDPARGAVDNLRASLAVLTTFGHRHRKLLSTLVIEALGGGPLAAAFLRENLPRHIAVIAHLLTEGQAAGAIVPAPVPHLLPFIVGAIGGPLFAGGAIERVASAAPGPVEYMLLSPAARELRIELALRAIVIAPTQAAQP